MHCSTNQPFMCACFFWETEGKQALTWHRITAGTEGEAVNGSVNTGQTVALGAGHPAGSHHCFAQAAWGPWRQGSCCLQLELCLHGSSWKLALVLLAPRQAQYKDAPSALAHPRTLMRRTRFLLLGTHFVWLQGLNITPGPHSSPRVPAACWSSGINTSIPSHAPRALAKRI